MNHDHSHHHPVESVSSLPMTTVAPSGHDHHNHHSAHGAATGMETANAMNHAMHHMMEMAVRPSNFYQML